MKLYFTDPYVTMESNVYNAVLKRKLHVKIHVR